MKKTKIIAGILAVSLFLGGCGSAKSDDITGISSVKLKSNQKIVIGKITEIAGNEITYTILEKASSNDNTKSENQQTDSQNTATTEDKKKMSPKKNNMTMYTSTNESESKTIPVGTDVITSLGNKTTFSRLSNGDVIQMIVEKDNDGNWVIVGIWMT